MRKKLIFGVSKKSGHNFYGRITVYGKGGGRKEKLRFIDYKRIINSKGFVIFVERDIKHTGFLGIICYDIGLLSYILLGEGLKIFDKFYGYISKKTEIFLNSSYLLNNLNIGKYVYNVENLPGNGGIYARAAGLSAFIYLKKKDRIFLKMNSGWLLSLSNYCMSVVGSVSNREHKFNIIKKAGNSRIYGKRPKVRGVAMNPCDHPHGGGEGKKSTPVTPYSKFGKKLKFLLTKNKKFQKRKKKEYKKV